MFNPLIFHISRKFSKSVKQTRFTRVSYILSVLAFILATLAITLITSVLYSMQEFQKNRLLNYTPQIIVSYNQPLGQNGEIDTAKLQQAYTQLQQTLGKDINRLNLYAGGKFFLQIRQNLIEGQVLGLDNSNPAAIYPSSPEASLKPEDDVSSATTQANANNLTNTHDKLVENIPYAVLTADLNAGEYYLAIPQTLAYQYQLNVGDTVTLINNDKSTYLPSGFMPIMREFTISQIYADNGQNNVWYANVFDIARLNLSREVNQVNIFLKDPLAIEQAMQKLAQANHLQVSATNPYALTSEQTSTTTTTTNQASSQTSQADQQEQLLTPIAALDWRDRLAVVFGAIKTEGRVTTTLTSLLIIIAILSCLITFSFIIVEKDRDIAILNVLGMSPKDLNKVFLMMVVGLLVRANIWSILLFITCTFLWPFYSPYLAISIPLQINYLQVALTYLLCSAAIFIATAIAGYFIIRIRPAQILR
ncbi:ABC transporter permease [Psittacicella hinzii]|uniref:ABC3 transporter permease C-terminal domain-containing protein n=1 Tax=Psittacicella hinzii TaxID=2028575 RepID=A0A3A1YM55_9GAMM|nr:FtsX-like permease family protein [Psittacicella hinzii]RIY37097.1 hypothetical protein CKF58_05395 [Psittacicella hinzii]